MIEKKTNILTTSELLFFNLLRSIFILAQVPNYLSSDDHPLKKLINFKNYFCKNFRNTKMVKCCNFFDRPI